MSLDKGKKRKKETRRKGSREKQEGCMIFLDPKSTENGSWYFFISGSRESGGCERTINITGLHTCSSLIFDAK